MNRIYIYGAGGHGLVLADMAKACGYKEVIFIDNRDNEHLTFDEVEEFADIIVAIGNNKIRKKVTEEVQESLFTLVSLIHPSAVISDNVTIGRGSVVMPNVVINTHATIGQGAIINTSVVVEHENEIGAFAHLSPNVALGGAVKVGNLTHVGIGSSVIQGVTIGRECVVGAGSVVLKDIADKTIAYGNPCLSIGAIDE